MTDIVPTVCYLMDPSIPAQAEGAIPYQALEDPNALLEEKKGWSGISRGSRMPTRPTGS